jgi:hypothetical protein
MLQLKRAGNVMVPERGVQPDFAIFAPFLAPKAMKAGPGLQDKNPRVIILFIFHRSSFIF